MGGSPADLSISYRDSTSYNIYLRRSVLLKGTFGNLPSLPFLIHFNRLFYIYTGSTTDQMPSLACHLDKQTKWTGGHPCA